MQAMAMQGKIRQSNTNIGNIKGVPKKCLLVNLAYFLFVLSFLGIKSIKRFEILYIENIHVEAFMIIKQSIYKQKIC